MIVRRATPDDVVALTAVLQAAYAPFQSLGLPPVTEGIAEDICNHNVWVAEVDGALRGGIVLVLGPHAHIANLAVHPDASGHGIGQSLLETASKAAAAAGHDVIKLATHAEMQATRAFYRKLGWSEAGRGAEKVYFEKQLI